tara:strand:+ start:215 stop:799 length:585 start_codon:yes stop_codon:yes gene_type:complete
MSSVLNILAKNPEGSDCKTRLSGLLTKDERIFLSKEMLKITCGEMSSIDVDKFLYLYPNTSGDFVKNLSSDYGIKTLRQPIGPLSKKIYTALESRKNKFEKRVVIGSDIPSLSKSEIYDCLDYLDYCDLVLGPSKDNGFYLVGVKNQSHECFKSMNLNEIHANDITDICRAKKIKYRFLRVLKDIDTPDDLLNL